jgi:hypothetical protein
MAKASSCEWLAYREVGSEHCTNEEIRFKNARFCVFFFGTNEFSNYRFLTPRLHAFPVLHGEFSSPFQLPVFDASKTEARIQKIEARLAPKRRRQKPVVHFTSASPQTEASKPGSVRKITKKNEADTGALFFVVIGLQKANLCRGSAKFTERERVRLVRLVGRFRRNRRLSLADGSASRPYPCASCQPVALGPFRRLFHSRACRAGDGMG